jgi:hypothetical protein
MLWARALTDRLRTRVIGAGVPGPLSGACLFMALSIWAALLSLAIFALRFALPRCWDSAGCWTGWAHPG